MEALRGLPLRNCLWCEHLRFKTLAKFKEAFSELLREAAPFSQLVLAVESLRTRFLGEGSIDSKVSASVMVVVVVPSAAKVSEELRT